MSGASQFFDFGDQGRKAAPAVPVIAPRETARLPMPAGARAPTLGEEACEVCGAAAHFGDSFAPGAKRRCGAHLWAGFMPGARA